ncbi:Bifunctional NADPH reductase [compost metagenome]
MMNNSQDIIDLLDRGGKLYVCGDGSRMAPEVEQSLQKAYQQIHGVSEQQARDWLDRLLSEGRYAKDVWAGL